MSVARPTSATVAAVVVAAIALTARADDDRAAVQWVRLCTSTGDGGSRLNATTPCGVRVQDAVVEQPPIGGRGVEWVRLCASTGDGGSRLNATMPCGVRVQDEVVEQPPIGETDSGPDPEDEDVDVVVDDGDDHDGDHDDDDHDDDHDDDDHDDEDGRDAIEKRRGGAATKLMVAYLLDARNRLYNKIHDLLDLLRRAFFDAQLSRRSRRDTARRRQARDVGTARRANKNKKPSITSMIMKPTFERSMMTMSFLMFGVFVIRVVQRLVQTLQHPGEISPSLPGGVLSAALSGLF